MANPQAQLQALTDTYQSLQSSLNSTIAARQKLASQQQENQSVQATFSNLADDGDSDDESSGDRIYKLVGPVLLKQDKAEAVMAVEGRLAYINKEIERVEASIGEMRGQSEELKMQIYQLQSQLQGEQAQG